MFKHLRRRGKLKLSRSIAAGFEPLESRQLMSASLTIANPNVLPSNTRFVFNRIQNQNPIFGDIVHDTNTVQLINTGDQPLTINALTLSDPAWQLVNPPAAGTVIAPDNGELDVQVQFVATTLPSSVPYNETNGKNAAGGGVYTGTLTINSDDPVQPTQTVTLAGYWQRDSEHSEEPSLQTIVNLLGGYTTNIASGHQPALGQGATMPTYYGEEVASPYWSAADPTQPVTIQQLDAFHTQGNAAFVSWFDKGNSANPNLLWITVTDQGQGFFPQAYGPDNTRLSTVASFSPAGAFGLQVDNETSVESLNFSGGGGEHHFRFYPLRDAQGLTIPNTFLAAEDYGGPIANCDFNDNVFIMTNVHPEMRPATVANLTAVSTPNVGVALSWSPAAQSDVIGYNVYRATTLNGSYTKLNGGPLITFDSFVDATATPNTTYFYRVNAVNSIMLEGYSVTVSAIGPVSATKTPGAPTGIAITSVTGNQISIQWNDIAGESGFKIERGTSATAGWKQIGITSAGVTNFTDATVIGNTTYFYRVHAYNPAGTSGTIGVVSAKTLPGLISGWNSADVGSPAIAGSSIASAGVFNITGGGADVYGTSDQFQYAYTTWNGNGQIIARVDGSTGADPQAKAGIMFRDSLDPGSREVMMQINADGLSIFEDRAIYDDNTSIAVGPVVTTPYWVKLIRAGSVFTGLISADDVHWTVVGSANIPMNSTVQAGLISCAHDNSAVSTATFDNVFVGKIASPTTPTNLISVTATASEIDITWTDPNFDATGFLIERSTDGVHFSQIAAIDPSLDSFANTGLAHGKTYYYRVRATEAGIDSAYSNISGPIAL
jgi:hypothetical protein